jgi:hypothetical protein
MVARSGIFSGGILRKPQYVNETTTKATNAAGAFLDAGVNTGTASVTLADATIAATGALLIQGTLSKTLDNVTASGTGTLLIAAAASKTLDDATLVATGTLRIAATASVTLDDVTVSATATKSGDELLQLVEAAKGAGGISPKRRRRRKVEGAIAWALPRLGLAAIGEASDPPEGDFRGHFTLGLTLRAAGAIGVRGHIKIDIPGLSLFATAFVAPCGTARVEFEPVLRCYGRHDHFNETELALLPLILELL